MASIPENGIPQHPAHFGGALGDEGHAAAAAASSGGGSSFFFNGPALRLAVGRYLASNLHVIVILTFVALLVGRKLLAAYRTRDPRRNEKTFVSMEARMAAARARQAEATLKAQSEHNASQAEAAAASAAAVAAAAGHYETLTADGSSAAAAPVAAAALSPAAAAFMARRSELIARCPDTLAARVTGGRRLGSAADGNAASSAAAPAAGGEGAGDKAAADGAAPKRPPAKPSAKPANRLANDSDEDDPRGPRKRLPKLSGGTRADWEAGNSGGGCGGDRKDYFRRDTGPRGG